MSIQEAREALMDQWFAPLIEHDGNKFAAALDAYGAARELKGHVDACKNFIYKNAVTQYASSQAFSEKRYCGDGWLCDDAREIEELGR